MAEWLVKTEPSDYSFDHLERDGQGGVGRGKESRRPSRTSAP